MNIEEIKKHYQTLDDFKLEQIAMQDAGNLEPEVLEVLKDEIKRRNLNSGLLDSVEVQSNSVDEADLMRYCELLMNQVCPVCQTNRSKLNVTLVGQATSFIIMTSYNKDLKIACADCLDQMHSKANLKSGVFGWWGFPWGPVQTVRSFMFNAKMKKQNHADYPNDLVKGFVLNNYGVFAAAKDNPQVIVNLIRNTNNKI